MVFQPNVLFFLNVCQVTGQVDDCNSERFQNMMVGIQKLCCKIPDC